MKMKAGELNRAVSGWLPVGHPQTEFEGAFSDSREVREGALFVGIRGENADGGQHAAEALRGGAAAALVSKSAWMWIEGEAMALRKPVVVVDDTTTALGALGTAALEMSGAQVIGVTGAVGKTTTKDILLAMLRAAGVAAEATPGNRNTEIGVPLALLDLSEGTEIAVVEMGMRGAGQIARLAELAPPTVGCITAIAPVHLELLGTIEAVAAAKAELLSALGAGGVAVVPEGEPLLEEHLAALPSSVEVRRFGESLPEDLELDLPFAWQRVNAAAALECCRAVGHVPPPGTPIAVNFSGLRGEEIARASGGTVIADCYNANPAAMDAALVDLAGRPGRRVAVLGDMFELGDDEKRFHREVGKRAVELGIDLIVGVGQRAGEYVNGTPGGVHFADVDSAREGLPAHVGDGDIVLLKGSRGMALERLLDVVS
jgi:UDP-N-acetylmuramyl pentapeptide synthase